MNNIKSESVDYLLTPVAIRATTKKIYDFALSGKTHFKINTDKLEETASFVMEVIKENYPEYNIPFHSRWGHFKAGGIDREALFLNELNGDDKLEVCRKKLDLVITSVLLDAGAGASWKYLDSRSKTEISRSEGLAVASFDLFMDGAFSNDKTLLADNLGLKNFSEQDLIEGFQVGDANPLVGVFGRVALINKLGDAVSDSSYFPGQRPGSMVDYLIRKKGNSFEVQDILDVVLRGLGPIWPGRLDVDGVNLGDVWHHSLLGDTITEDSVVCFHKLSQWLTYSLVTPMIEAGLEVTGAEKLTGLAEYRNGGLFLDSGLIELRDPSLLEVAHKPSSELVIEWRALTVQLLDQMGEIVQKKLGKSPSEFPLAKVLEGGTWWAGRKIASLKRDGTTPIKLDSDGTVF